MFDSGSLTDRNKGDTVEYANWIFSIYDNVAGTGLPNFILDQIPVPSILNLKAWCQIAVIPAELTAVAFLTFGFPAGYEGLITSPSTDNHASNKAHPRNIAHYITTEIGYGAMLGPFDHPPFTPSCQINPLLTHPKKDSTSQRVIFGLSCPLQVPASMGPPRHTYLGVP